MTQLLHLADISDLDRLSVMVQAFHGEAGIVTTPEHRDSAIRPLLEGSSLGAIWMIGPKMAPVGYVCVSFGWSIELGGLDATIDELWIREKVRGRGMGSEAVAALQAALSDAGVKALHLEALGTATRIYERAGFQRRAYPLMTWVV